MSRTLILKETVSAPEKTDRGWMITVATPGQGSSGNYSEELLREQGPAALHPGAQSFLTHDAARNPKDMIGIFPDGAFWEEETSRLRARLQPFSHWEDFVNEVGPHAGMSIYMHGEKDQDGNVTQLIPHPQNGCDLVSRPGLEGSGLDEKLYESLRAGAHAQAEENEQMEKLEQKVDALTELFSQFVASQDKLKEGDEVSPEEMVAEALDKFQDAVAEIDKAELLPSQVEDLRGRAKRGEDVAPLIESAKKVNAELKEQFEAAQKAADEGLGNVLGGIQIESATELGKAFG